MSAPSAAPSPSSSASPGFGWATRFLGDEYVWKARKAPVLLVALPLFFAAGAWVGTAHLLAMIPAGIGCFLLGVCGHIGRIQGKSREEALWAGWGGKPTTRMLRHRDTPFSTQKLALLHAKLEAATGVKAPSPRAENTKPDEADRIYEGYATYLRNATRESAKFPRVREELVNYGFARNVWGLQPLGLAVALVALVATGARGWWLWKDGASQGMTTPIVLAIFNAAILLFWLFLARENWVRQIAEAYAARLLEAADILFPNSQP